LFTGTRKQTEGALAVLDETVIYAAFLCVYAAIPQPKYLPREFMLCHYRQLRHCQKIPDFNS